MSTKDKAGTGTTQTLNVLFHGLWAYEVTQDGWIVVRTTPQDDHAVKAGGWIPESDLRSGGEYTFEGIDRGNDGNFKAETNAIIGNRDLDVSTSVFCTVRLPLPRSIHSLRPIVFHADRPPYTGGDAHLVTTRQIAIVQVFTYSADDLNLVKLVNTNLPGDEISPVRSETAPNMANFYFFAQPEDRVHTGHFEVAFAKLAALYGLDLVPVNSIPPGPRNPNVPGLIWRDLVGLNERSNSRDELIPAGGSSGSNCDPFVIDNRNNGAKQRPVVVKDEAAYPANEQSARSKFRREVKA